jgi:Rrf2 family protein
MRMMVELAKQSNGGKKVSLGQVARKAGISRRYLEQLAIGLKHASLITGITGRGGGYLLARPAEEIKIGQIVEAVIGPINIVECVLQPDQCMQVDYCVCRPIYKRINTRITDVLNEFSLADLAHMDESGGVLLAPGEPKSACPERYEEE